MGWLFEEAAIDPIEEGVETGMTLGLPFGVDMLPMMVGEVDVAAEDGEDIEDDEDMEDVDAVATVVSLLHPDSR